jgi:predicted transcriptional regulator
MPERMEISKILGSDVKLEILALFHENPELTDKIDGVSKRIGRDTGEIEAEVRDLIDIGILRTKTVESSKIIYYDQKNDVEIQKRISYQLRKGI